MSDIRGLLIQSRIDYLENSKTESAFQNVLQRLSDPVRQAIGEQVFPTNLYSFHLLRDLDNAIGETISEPLETIFKEIGKKYAHTILDRYFYNYVEKQNPQKFLSQLGNLYPHLWDFGTYRYVKSDNHSAKVEFFYDDDVHKSYCWFMQSFLKEGIAICGGKSIDLKEEACEAENDESCIYQVKWQD